MRPVASGWRMAARIMGAATLLVVVVAARADGPRADRTPVPAEYTQECGSCHVAYPPRLLPAASWQRVMDNLSRHYGTDASLDAATARSLSAWLQAHAGAGKAAREPPPEDRITRARWFQREHAEVPSATWTLPAVKNPANCAACHLQADQGDFSEHHVRIPR